MFGRNPHQLEEDKQAQQYLPSVHDLELLMRFVDKKDGLPDKEATLQLMWFCRFGEYIVLCPQCGRETTFVRPIPRKDTIFECQWRFCRYEVNPLVGTIFADTRIPLSKWFKALWLVETFVPTEQHTTLPYAVLAKEVDVSWVTARKMFRLIHAAKSA